MTEHLKSVFLTGWSLKCETELVIRSEIPVKVISNEQEFEVTDLYAVPMIEKGSLVKKHLIPASSIRGALRSYLIQKLIPEIDRNVFRKVEKKGDEVTETEVQDWLTSVKSILNKNIQAKHIIGLFGFALDTRFEDENFGQAGRITLETKPLSVPPLMVMVDESGQILPSEGGSTTVRNPLDRITHASIVHGLHRFLEFSRGTEILVTIRIVNPTAFDFRVIDFLAQEINIGLLRFGALSSIGRGRVTIAKSNYAIWSLPKYQVTEAMDDQVFQKETYSNSNEIFSEFWEYKTISEENLNLFAKSIGENYA